MTGLPVAPAKRIAWFGAVVAFVLLLGGPALAVEEPAFHTVAREGAFEIRDYPQLVVAEVTVSGDQKSAASRGFRLLAGYIFGGNQGGRSIAMTAPVIEAPAGVKIAMTAPVTQTEAGREWVVRFNMPHTYTLETLPRPKDARVHLREAPAARLAVIRFSGLAEPGAVAARTAELKAWVQRRKLQPVGPASLAQYDPPWTLWFMRRNEVMIPIAR